MSNGFPPLPPRTPAMPFPQGYDPTAAAALEMMRATGQPTPNPRMGPVPQQPYTAPMPPGWVGGPAAVGPGEALASAGKQLLNPASWWQALKGVARPFYDPVGMGRETAEQVQALNKAGHPILGAGAMALGVGAPELEATGPEVNAITRPILYDIEHAASGAADFGGFKIPQAAILSAARTGMSKAEQQASHTALLDLLKSEGLPHVETSGKWFNPTTKKWEIEPSVLIPGMERAQAAHLGERLGQQSVITIGGESPGYHDLQTGQTMPFKGIRQATKKDPHTILPSGKKIALDFDWDNPQQMGTPAPKPRGVSGTTLPGEPVLPAGAPEVLGASDPKYAYKTPPVYHGTHAAGFDVPTQSSDLGVHTGTREQATSLLAQKEQLGIGSEDERRNMRLYSTAKNPLRINTDLGQWHPAEVANTLAEHPAFKGTPAEQSFRQIAKSADADMQAAAAAHTPSWDWTKAHQASRSGWLNEIKTTLKGHGYDAIEYPNSFEGKPSHIINNETGDIRPYRAGTATDVDMGAPERSFSGFSTIHLDPSKTLSTKPTTRGFAIPPEDLPSLGMGVAHLGAGAKTPQAFAAAVSKVHPELGAQMTASPWVANKMFGTVQKYRKMIEGMPSTEQAIATARSPEGQGIQHWYNGTDKVLQDAGLSQRERDVFHRIGAISSIQKSPQAEVGRALDAFGSWAHTGPMADFSRIPGYTNTQKKMLEGIAVDNPWTDVTKGPKVSGYVMARQGQPEAIAIDRHIAEYYTGKKTLNETEHGIVEGRIRHDAQAAGMTPREFQAAVWGGKTKYAPGYGQSGATLENWLRYHLASGKYDDLLEKFPGFRKLAEEGAHMGEHLPPSESTGQGNLPF